MVRPKSVVEASTPRRAMMPTKTSIKLLVTKHRFAIESVAMLSPQAQSASHFRLPPVSAASRPASSAPLLAPLFLLLPRYPARGNRCRAERSPRWSDQCQENFDCQLHLHAAAIDPRATDRLCGEIRSAAAILVSVLLLVLVMPDFAQTF